MKKLIKSVLGTLAFAAVVLGVWLAYQRLPEADTSVSALVNYPVTDWSAPDEEYLSFYGMEPFETHLPVVYIDTKGQRITKENKIWASIAVTDAATDGSLRSVMELPDSQYPITIKYRGASSYSRFDKKQYRIKFYEEEGKNKSLEVPFLGMGQHSEWVLNGPFLDKTLMRNRLVYSLSREIFDWAPDTRFVEVFLDGEYQGVYVATEPVTNGLSRLRLSEFGMSSGKTAYVVKRDRVGTEADPLMVYGRNAGKTSNELYIEYPSAKKLTSQQRNWIVNDISKFERALYGDDFADPELGYRAYINLDDFVDYVIINEVFMNNDAGNLSTYVYKELGGKLQMAVWDFNNGLDNYQWFVQYTSEFFTTETAWFNRLYQDRFFVDSVIARYHELRQTTLSDAHLNEMIEGFQAELGDAIDRNFQIWGYTFDIHLLSNLGRDRNPTSYEQAVSMMTDTLFSRLAYLDSNIDTLYFHCIN